MSSRRNYICSRLLTVIVALLALTSCENEAQFTNNGNGVSEIFYDDILRFVPSKPTQYVKSVANNSESKLVSFAQTADGNVDSTLSLYYFETQNDQDSFNGTNSTETKSIPIETDALIKNNVGSFGVFGSLYSDWSKKNELSFDFFRDQKVVYSSGKWKDINTHYWSTQKGLKHRFYAYAPYKDFVLANGDKLNSALSVTEGKGTLLLDYKVPQEPVDQVDLMYAIGKPDNSDGYTYVSSGMPAVELPFQHALTAVRIVTGITSQQYIIDSIQLCNVVDKGVFDVENKTWALDYSQRSSYSKTNITVYSVNEYQDADQTIIFDGDSTLMLLPQNLDGVTLRIHFSSEIQTDGAGNYREVGTYEFTDLGSDWLAGTIRTYVINLGISPESEWKLETEDFEDGVLIVDHNSHSTEIVVNSFVTIKNSTGHEIKKHVDWNLSYSIDGGEHFSDDCDWLSTKITKGQNGLADIVSAYVAAQIPYEMPHVRDDLLKAAAQKGVSSDPIDLSTNNKKSISNYQPQNTANCYIVDAPGYYSIPMVYGNGYKNGNVNYSAWNSGEFVDYKGSSLRDYQGNKYYNLPWICASNNITRVELLWEDVAGLVTNVSLDAQNPQKYLTFEVGRSTIRQGNAIIAAYNGNDIMWSWHIWVTNYDPNSPTSTDSLKVADRDVRFSYYGNYYDLSTVNVGWVYIGLTVFPEREVILKFEQKGNPQNYQTFRILQTEHQLPNRGFGMFYQWGRKDPFPAWYATMTKRKFRDNDTEGFIADIPAVTSGGTYADLIKNPEVFYGGKPNSQVLWNLSSNIADNTLKTIYDPCPVGYCVASQRALEYLIQYNKSHQDSEANNFDGSWWGRYFFNEGGQQKIWLPATGHRNDVDGTTQNKEYAHDQGEGTDATYWSSTSSGYNMAYCINFYGWVGCTFVDNAQGHDLSSLSMNYGECVRMMREK